VTITSVVQSLLFQIASVSQKWIPIPCKWKLTPSRPGAAAAPVHPEGVRRMSDVRTAAI